MALRKPSKKALSVLKEKVAPGLQSLCVSILDDSNLDMERSVDGITDYMSKTTSHEMQREMNRLSGGRREVILYSGQSASGYSFAADIRATNGTV